MSKEMSEVAILLLINHLQSLVILFKNFARLKVFSKHNPTFPRMLWVI